MATELSEKEELLLQALLKKGPALPVELAARTLSFPDEVSASIRALADRGLVEIEPLARGRLGGKIIYLSEKGKQHLNNLEG
jgi:DNA-binding MarR family transcriptional regulator